MRFDLLPSSLLSLLAVTFIQSTSAGLIPDLLDSLENLQNYVKRCENPCGYYGQLCCPQGDTCYTDAKGQAQCAAGGALTQVQATATATGTYQYYTTTFVMTDLTTVTSTWSSLIPVATVVAPAGTCNYGVGQYPCGNVCCNSGQYCQQAGICVAVPGSSGYYSSLATVTVTNTAGAPLRPTSNSVTTLTTTGTAVSTAPFQTPVGTNGAVLTGAQETSGGGGLSGGAIAGIVIGVIAGIILLFLICACCCFKGLIDGLLGIFGLGGRRRRRTEEVEVYEERHHHGGRTWYGANRPTGGGTVVEEKRKKKDSGLGNFAKAGIFLGGLGALLGLKRRSERRDDKSNSGYSYYDSEYYTSSSKSS